MAVWHVVEKLWAGSHAIYTDIIINWRNLRVLWGSEDYDVFCRPAPLKFLLLSYFNLLAPELFFLILAHHLNKMWIIQGPNKLDLWNKLHFEEEITESIYHV